MAKCILCRLLNAGAEFGKHPSVTSVQAFLTPYRRFLDHDPELMKTVHKCSLHGTPETMRPALDAVCNVGDAVAAFQRGQISFAQLRAAAKTKGER